MNSWGEVTKVNAVRRIKYIFADQTGASAVEFAIILPLLVLFVFGIIEFSIMFYDKAVITNASREAARAGIVFADPRPQHPEISDVAINYFENRVITFGSPSWDIPVITPCVNPGDELTVVVNYEYDFLLVPNILAAFFSGGAFADGQTITAITKMRCE